MRRFLAAVLACAAIGCGGEPRGPCDPHPAPGSLGSICGFHNPEDLEIIPALGLLVVSEMRGSDRARGGALAVVRLADLDAHPEPRRLWPLEGVRVGEASTEFAFPSDPSCTAPTEGFAPHGIASGPQQPDGTIPLAVVSHHPREAVELFQLSGRGSSATARWTGCLPLPPDTTGNDVVFGLGGDLLVTHYQPHVEGLRGAFYAVVSGLGGHTGEVLRWSPSSGWRREPETQGASPNGLLESADAATLYFSQTGAGLLGVIAHSAGGRSRRDLPIPGHPDNLSWGRDGSILVVSHNDGPAFLLCVFGRRPCRTSWSLWALDPDGLGMQERLRHDGDRLGAGTSVVEFAGRYYVGARYGDRIGVFHPADPSNDGRGDDAVLQNPGDEVLPDLRLDDKRAGERSHRRAGQEFPADVRAGSARSQRGDERAPRLPEAATS